MWFDTARLCSSLKGARMTPSFTGKVNRGSPVNLISTFYAYIHTEKQYFGKIFVALTVC